MGPWTSPAAKQESEHQAGSVGKHAPAPPVAGLSELVDIAGPVHVRRFGGLGRPLVLLHGLNGSYANWLSVGRGLTECGSVRAIDLLGSGFTPTRRRDPTVDSNTMLVAQYLARYAAGPAIIIAASLGALVALQVASRCPHLVDRLILVAPAISPWRSCFGTSRVGLLAHLCASPLLGVGLVVAHSLVRSPQGRAQDSLRLACTDPKRIPEWVRAEHAKVARERTGLEAARDFVRTASSYRTLLHDSSRLQKTINSILAPVLVVQGDQDRIVSNSAAQQMLTPQVNWDIMTIHRAGHALQLEQPAAFIRLVTEWLGVTRRAEAVW
jgi:pimeloyl-ACP methyl ester carboxylesterase